MKADDKLSRAASEILRASNGHALAAYYDAGFDAGEWSGAAHEKMEAREQEKIARKYGFKSTCQLWDALEERTNAKWMHFEFPFLLGEDN